MKNSYWTSTGEEPAKIKAGWFSHKYSLKELFERTEIYMGIFPNMRFKFVFLETKQDVIDLYKSRYAREFNASAFMSKSKLTAWFSLEDLTPAIFVHEVAHLLFTYNQHHRVSYNFHEGIAKMVTKMVLKCR